MDEACWLLGEGTRSYRTQSKYTSGLQSTCSICDVGSGASEMVELMSINQLGTRETDTIWPQDTAAGFDGPFLFRTLGNCFFLRPF